MTIPFQACNVTPRPLDIFLSPVFWKPSLTDTRAFTLFVMFWNKTYAHTVWISLDNMVLNAIFVKQIIRKHPYISVLPSTGTGPKKRPGRNCSCPGRCKQISMHQALEARFSRWSSEMPTKRGLPGMMPRCASLMKLLNSWTSGVWLRSISSNALRAFSPSKK